MKSVISSLLITLAIGTATVQAQNSPIAAPQQQKVEVSDAELEKFAEVFQQMRMVNQEAQKEMMQVVQEEGFELQRFNEIHQASMDPNKEIETTPEEDKKHQKVVKELESMQPKFQKEMEEVIANSDISMQRYQQLAMALRTDPELQKRLQEIMQS